ARAPFPLAWSAVDWDSESEAGSVRGGVARKVAIVLVGDAAGDREAEAVAGLAGVESDEAFEDPLAFVLGHAGSVIGNARLDVSVEPLDVDVDLARGLDGSQGVVDQVAEDALDGVG